MLSLFLATCLSLTASTFAATVHFKLELTWGKGSPDGYDRDMIFINGQHPGPLLNISENDWVEIEVCNLMPFNSTLHAHGMSSATARHHGFVNIAKVYIRLTHLGRMVYRVWAKDQFRRALLLRTNGVPIHMAATFTTHTAVDKSTTGHSAQS
jgi:hypothetical protein